MFKQLAAKRVIAEARKDESVCPAFDQLTGLVSSLAAGRYGEALPDNGFTATRQAPCGRNEIHVNAAEHDGGRYLVFNH
jgi:hypothetical protein